MADERSETPRPSWRDNAGSGSTPRPEPAANPGASSGHEWTRRRTGIGERMRRPGAWGLRATAALVAFLAFAGGAIALIWYIQPLPPTALVLVGADYATNLAVPQNVAGVEGIRGLEDLIGRSRSINPFQAPPIRLIQKRLPLERSEDWGILIEGIAEPGIVKKYETVVLVLALHGTTDDKEAYLLPNAATAPGDRLPLRDVIASLAKLPKENPKLHVLEPADVTSEWPLGMVHNAFARRLEELGPEIALVKNLYVLCASGVDQRGWTSEGLGRSPFFHYLTEGLRGRAAESNGRLSLDMLYNYVRKNVSAWVWNARQAVQEPLLISAGKSSGSGVFVASARDPKTPAFAASPDRASLVRAWKTFRELDRLVPHPSAYSPSRWRNYRANLIRYDELIRAGSTQADRLVERLSSLERRIKADRLLDLPASSENTLAMNAVEGGRIDAPSLPTFNTMWTAETDDERSRIWKDLTESSATDPDLRIPSLRSRVDLFLLRRAAETPSSNLASAASRLRLTRGTDFPQPAEAHFARMVNKYLDASKLSARDWALVGQAIKVRRHAEISAVAASGLKDGTHAYSEQVLPWTRALVEQADAPRRQGEDQIFATGEQARVEARQALDRAEQLYGRVDLLAANIRESLAVRDRVLGELIEYSRWVSHRRSLPGAVDDDKVVKAIEDLWTGTHELTEMLGTVGDASRVVTLAKTISRDFEAVADRFAEQKADIDLKRTGEDWEVATAATRVAFADSDGLSLRETIWKRLDNIRQKDQELASRGNMEGPKAEESKRQMARVKSQALIEGRMALAALGKAWFDAARFQGQGDHAGVSHQLASARTSDDKSWRLQLAEAGKRIGQRWQGFPAEIDKLVAEAAKNPAEARANLGQADRWSRQAGVSLSSDAAPEPGTRHRGIRTHDLLVWNARRAWLDHWYDEDPAERPYYQLIGGRYLDDAEALWAGSSDVAALRTQLKAPASLGFDEPSAQVVTSELKPAITYSLVENGEVPPGTPVVRARTDLRFRVEGEGASYRAVSRRRGDQPAQPAEFSFSSPLVGQAETDPSHDRPVREVAAFVAEGFLRGQIFERKTPVTIDPVPEIIAIGPAPASPPQASLAVRADPAVIERFGEGNGAIAFVLDCSGSMIDPAPAKFEEAKKALIAALRTVPRGTRLSILTFGQAGTGFVREFPRAADREDVAMPERTINSLRAPGAWNPEQLDGLIQQLSELRPYHGTPLVQAMASAKKELDDAKGFKTMVVLTDGKDTRFTANTAFNPGRLDIPTFLRTHFNKSDVMINMVFFKTVESEMTEARQQFASAIAGLDPPGKLFTVTDVNRLITTLQSAVHQALVCKIVKGDDGAVVGSLDVTSPGEADRWWTKGLAPGAYTLRVAAGRTYSRGVNLETGDRLIVKLVLGPDNGIGFDRALYGDDARQGKEPVAESAGWQLAVLANRAPVGTSRLELMAALEPRVGESAANHLEPIPSAGAIKQVDPALAWFSIEPSQGHGPFQLRWRERSLYPAPVWQLEVPRWLTDPTGAGPDKPVFKAWWLTGAEVPAAATLKIDSPQGVNGAKVEAIDGSTVVVESIRVEDHRVESRPGSAPETLTCLVVRLSYPEGKPFIIDPARLGGLKAERYEHRLYTSSHKYTGLFWPVSRSQVESSLKDLGLIALDPSRRQAEERKQTIELKLNRPRPEDRLPEPPTAVVGP